MTERRSSQVLGAVTQVVINFFPANFSREEIWVWRGPYSEEALRDLLAKYPGVGFLRDKDNGRRMYAWEICEDSGFSEPGFTQVEVTRSSHPALFSRIMIEGIGRHLKSIGFVRLPSKPYFHRYVNFSLGNLAADIPAIKDDQYVGIYPKLVLQSFFTSFEKDKPVIGLLADVDYAFKLDVPVDQLAAMGVDVRGLYVRLQVPPDADSSLREFDRRMVGKVKRIQSDKVELEDTRHPKLYEVPVAWCVPEPSRHNLNSYLQSKYASNYQSIQSQINSRFASHISPKRRLTLIEGLIRQRLSTNSEKPVRVAARLDVWFDLNYPVSPDKEEFKLSVLGPAEFSFDSASTHPPVNSADTGLDRYGPYDHEQMAKRNLRVLFVSPEDFKGQVERFVEQFKSGLGERSRYSGFLEKYRIDPQRITIEKRFFRRNLATEATDYYDFCRQIAAKQGQEKWDLCFVVTREATRGRPAKDNPYYLCKNLLLGFDITVQNVLVETLAKPQGSLQFILNNIALATYAKLGGRPFLLKTSAHAHYELVFGIGSSVLKQSRFGAGRRVVGITTLFTRDGDYILNGCTPYTDFDSYERRLRSTVEQAIRDAIEIQAIEPTEKVRLIFHVFKEIGRKETQAIQEAVAAFDGYDIEYAIVHVNTDHSFRMFDRMNAGRTRNWKTGNFEQEELAAYVAERGLMVRLGPRERLVNLIGPRQYRKRGCPTPLRITLDRSSTFTDVDYICQQIFHFSAISWRSFQMSREPITIMYSSWIADLNAKLSDLGGWNPERVNINLRRKMWFL